MRFGVNIDSHSHNPYVLDRPILSTGACTTFYAFNKSIKDAKITTNL